MSDEALPLMVEAIEAIKNRLDEIDDRLNVIDHKIERLASDYRYLERELDSKVQDVRFESERESQSIRSDLSSLEHKVNYG